MSVDETEYVVEETGISKTNGIDRFDDVDFNGFFDCVIDADSAKAAVDWFKEAEEDLKRRREYGRCAKKYCLLEAQMFVKISKIDGVDDVLRASEKRVVQWLRAKSDDEIDALVDKCGTGIRMSRLWDKECGKEHKRQQVNDECKRIQDVIVNEAVNRGKTRLNYGRFYEESRGRVRLPKDVVSAYTESTRDILLKKGMLGLGDGNGEYICPPRCTRDELARAILNRVHSILNDLRTLHKLCVNERFLLSAESIDELSSEFYMLTHDCAESGSCS